LPLDYYSNLPERINAVTPSRLRPWRKNHPPEKIIVLAVGDRAKIEEAMKKLNLGKMEIRDTEGKIVH